jgi:hypothetical protein
VAPYLLLGKPIGARPPARFRPNERCERVARVARKLRKMRQRSFISARMGPSGTATMAVSCPPRVDPWSEGFLPPAVLRRDDFTRPVPAKACMPAGSISPVTRRPLRLPAASHVARQERRRAVFRKGHNRIGNGALRDGATVGAPRYE